jgi:UDP-N-acetylmuramoyl-tripeptide--D-alanyl-D-alanine ligase
MTLGQVASAAGGKLSDASDAMTVIDGASTDSRAVSSGQLFVALRGERDGHDFIEAARAAGAVAWLTERPDPRPGAVVVGDAMAALVALGGEARAHVPDRLIAITGSSGKTTTKDLVSAVLGRRGPHVRSDKSFNNEIGVPLTLINAPDDAWAGVVEMGARGVGHIAALMEIARPLIGVVLNVGRAHVGMYEDGQLGIASAKGEIVEGLRHEGTAVLNADDPLVIAMADRTRADILRFSTTREDVEISAQSIVVGNDLCASFRIVTPWGSGEVVMGVPGPHQVANALAAAAACGAVGSSFEEIVEGLAQAQLSPWRMEVRTATLGFRILNDSYNANPESTTAGLRALAAMPARRRIAVLGAMAELGGETERAHGEVAALAADLGVDVVAVAAPGYRAGVAVDGIDEAVALITSMDLGPGDALLVKGSRVAGLERLAALLTGSTGQP